MYAERIARVGTPKVKATWQPNEIQIEVNTAPRTPAGWQGYFNKKVKEFGVYAVYNYSGVDRDGITSFAASEDLERVVKVIGPGKLSSARTPPTAVCPGSRGNLCNSILSCATRKIQEHSGRSAKTDVPKHVPIRHENDPRGHASGVISAGSGDRIRTCDLWVMS